MVMVGSPHPTRDSKYYLVWKPPIYPLIHVEVWEIIWQGTQLANRLFAWLGNSLHAKM